ncbi:MAG: OmpA family protein [Bacteroidetes bacterium]|nr:OmpA family protein [Bacteroidota bacterium]
MKKNFPLLLTTALVVCSLLRPVGSSAAIHKVDGPVLSEGQMQAADSTDSKGGKGGKSGKSKDSQNQTEYMKPDMESKDYNFYDRKKISTPLMPRYDLDSAVYQKGFKKKEEQQKAYLQNKYRYPARPKDQWELDLFGGSFVIQGDIKPDWTKGWGGGIGVRKAINYFFSIRGSYLYGWDKARELQPRFDVAHDGNLNGTLNNADYYHVNGPGTPVAEKTIFRNYRTMTHSLRVEGLVNLGNILFHRERNLVNVNLIAGVGAHMYRTQMDMLDKNGNPYDFSAAVADYNNLKANNTPQKDINKAISQDLDKILQGNYVVESKDPLKGGARIGHWNLAPDFNVGVGIDFHVSKWVTLGLEENFIFNNNSNLDGVNYQSDDLGGALAPHYDHYLASMLHVKIHLGKNRVEPLYWLNPMDFAYKKISDANPDKIANDILKDTDEDGVPDKLDKEPNTKKGCPVDVKGVVLDSDKDGIPDCDDKEPFSAPGYPIDANGVAQIPPSPCCDNDTSGLYGDNALAGGAGGKGGRRNRGAFDCSKVEMPGVYFDEDKYYIDPAYQSALHQVAEKLQMCPDVKMIVTGVDESSNNQKYNEQLAYNRATSVVDYLVEKYGISRDRFITKYQGGKKSNAAKTPAERKASRRVEFGYAADGEKGESNPPAPHPGLKAGSNK